jgi:hypothetical protein
MICVDCHKPARPHESGRCHDCRRLATLRAVKRRQRHIRYEDRIAREYWDAYESGRPMSDDDR